MLKIISIASILFASSFCYAGMTNVQTLLASKSWNVFKANSTATNTDVCGASVQVVDKAGVTSELFVGKMLGADGSYSSPVVFVTTGAFAATIYKGNLKTDAGKSYLLTLLQETGEPALLARYGDIAAIVSSLKAGNATKATFTAQDLSAPLTFSLSGSSKAIASIDQFCK